MKINVKKSALWIFGFGSVVAIPAFAIACHKTGKIDYIYVNQLDANLSKVSVTGDGREIKFVIPKEITNVNAQNELDAAGTEVAFDVYAKLSLTIGKTKVTSINSNYMPTALLESYLGGALKYEKSVLTMAAPAGRASVQEMYGSTFGFSAANLAALNESQVVGEWSAQFEVKFAPRGVYSTKSKLPLQATRAVAMPSAVNKYFSLPKFSLTQAAIKLKYFAGSTNESVQWEEPTPLIDDLFPELTSYVSSVEFTNQSVAGTTPSWSSALPTSFGFEPAKRILRARLIPKVTSQILSVTEIDLAAAAKLSTLPALFDSSTEYAALDLTKIKLSAKDGALVVDESGVTLPSGISLRYEVAPKPEALTKDNLQSFLQANPTTPLTSVSALLISTDAKITIINNKKTVVDSSAIIENVDTSALLAQLQTLSVDVAASTPGALVWKNSAALSTPFTNSIDSIEYLAGNYRNAEMASAAKSWSASLPPKHEASWVSFNLWASLKVKDNYLVSAALFDLTATSRLGDVIPATDLTDLLTLANKVTTVNPSRHDNLVWANLLTIPSSLQAAINKIEYLTGNYATATEANNAATWSEALPSATSFNSSERSFWMRLTPKASYRFDISIFDLTSSSQIQNVQAHVDAQTTFAGVDLATISLKDDVQAPTEDLGALALPTGTELAYQISGGLWMKWPNFRTELAKSTITAADLATIRVRLEVSSALYTLTNDKTATPKTDSLYITITTLPAALINSLQDLRPVAGAKHNSLVWNAAAPAVTDPYSGVEFLTGNYSSIALAAAAGQDKWEKQLPVVANYESAERYFYAKVIPAAHYRITNGVVDLTSFAKLDEILTVADAAPDFATLDLTKIVAAYASAASSPVFDLTKISLPSGLTLEFSAQQANAVTPRVWHSEGDFISAATQLGNFASLELPILARLRVTDALKFELTDIKEAAVTLAYNYDRFYSYEFHIFDTEGSYNLIGRINLYDQNNQTFSASEIIFDTTGGDTSKDYFSAGNNSRLGTALKVDVVFRFKTRKKVAALSTHIRNDKNYRIDLTISAGLTYLIETADYSKTRVRYKLVSEDYYAQNYVRFNLQVG